MNESPRAIEMGERIFHGDLRFHHILVERFREAPDGGAVLLLDDEEESTVRRRVVVIPPVGR